MNEQSIEQEIQAKGLTAPRVTPADIEANIRSEWYFTAQDGVNGESLSAAPLSTNEALSLLTFCVLHLQNGFTVTGESACASPENFDAEV
ncbi:Gp49 family protein, partial [Lacticaseibacillus paracasei]